MWGGDHGMRGKARDCFQVPCFFDLMSRFFFIGLELDNNIRFLKYIYILNF
jgi:hypothetical protein